jgi:hypothetical protein
VESIPRFMSYFIVVSKMSLDTGSNILIEFIFTVLTVSNPIFLPTAYSPLLFVLGGKEVGGLLVIILQI